MSSPIQGRSQLFLTRGAKRGQDIFQGEQGVKYWCGQSAPFIFFLYKFSKKVDPLKIWAAKSDKQKNNNKKKDLKAKCTTKV